MKGYWHFVAISTTIAILTNVYYHYWFFLIFFVWLCYLFYAKRLRKLPLLISLATFFIFLFWQPAHIVPPKNLSEQENTTYLGKVTSPLTTSDQKVEFTLQDNEAHQTFIVRYFFNEKQNHTKYESSQITQIKHGSTCQITGQLKHAEQSRNPGQFDYQSYLLEQGIAAQITVTSMSDITCEGKSLLHPIYSLRTTFQNHVVQKLTPYTSAWLNALVLGDRTLLSDETVSLFQRWGMSHILAISGLHIGLIVSLVYFLLVKLNVTTKEKAHMLIILFLPIYAIISGGQPSVWRASLMVLLFLIIRKLNTHYAATDILSIVFMILVIFDPKIVYHIGFQMSFIVTFSLILSKPWISETVSPFFQMLRISFIAQMVILPIQFINFYTFQPLSIIVNTIVIPYFSVFVIPFMFIVLMLSFLPAFLIETVDFIFVFVHERVITLIEIIDRIVHYPFVFGDFPFAFVLLFYSLFFLIMYYGQVGKRQKAFLSGALLTLVIVGLAIRPYFSPVGTVTMLDIGQGDAIVIELPYRKGVFMVDVGSRVMFDDEKLSDQEYDRIIKPYLDYRGIQKIDAIFVSHAHIDHMGSIPFLLKDKKVTEFIVSEYHEFNNEVGEVMKNSGALLTELELNDVIVRNGHTFNVLSPDKERGTNENSLVMQTVLGGKSWLLTGDMYKNNEQFILKNYKKLKIDVLKVAHHGSDTSTGETFINHLQPQVSLISVGHNFYGHPNEAVIDILETTGSLVLRTDENGAIQFRYRNNNGTFFKALP